MENKITFDYSKAVNVVREDVYKRQDGTCRFIVFDFDNHEKGAEATDFANVDSEWQSDCTAIAGTGA